jgi:Tol biopolymer transport system component
MDPLRQARIRRPAVTAGILGFLLLPAALGGGGAVITLRVSVDTSGAQGDGESSGASISGNGRVVAFQSQATNLVPGDTNGRADVFVRDLKTGTTAHVSVDSSGAPGDGESTGPSISGNGRFVAFHSTATNLVPGDSSDFGDVFVHDLRTGTTTRVSVDPSGGEADGDSSDPSISGNGRVIAFESDATNLVPGDTEGRLDVFVHDRKTGTTTRVSVDSLGAEADGESSDPSISTSGRFVVFGSRATNLVPGDTNDADDVFVHDLRTGATTRVSVGSAGQQADDGSRSPSISGNGRFVAFRSSATNLVPGDTNGVDDVFVHDLRTGTTTRVSVDSSGAQADEDSVDPSISANGRFVAFSSIASDLVPGDTNGEDDLFVHDGRTGTTTRASVDSTGGQADSGSFDPSISGNGRSVAFRSSATNLVPGDTNDEVDVFVRQ